MKMKTKSKPLLNKEILEKILSRPFPKEKGEFLIEYLKDVVVYRMILFLPAIREEIFPTIRKEDEARFYRAIQERIDKDIEIGQELGFWEQILADFASVISKDVKNIEEVQKWEKLLNIII